MGRTITPCFSSRWYTCGAQTPQRDDQNARLLGERDTVGGNHGAALLDPFAALALSAMPPATPTPTT